MATPLDPQQLQKLEQEALQAEKANDHLDALDVYEELLRLGWANARHLMSMGQCYMRIRQRQDAKSCWLRAYAMDPGFQPVQELLDQHFPGWESQSGISTTGSGRRETPDVEMGGAPPPPPPPPPNFGAGPRAGLSMETTSTRRAEPPPASARTAARPTPQRPASSHPGGAGGYHQQAHPSDAAQALPNPRLQPTHLQNIPASIRENTSPGVLAGNGANYESKVNWAYVMADAAEEALVKG